jgi:mono/diheme cytochrome c family protein
MRLVRLAGFAGVAQAQWASEAGFAVVQQQCMKCHRKANMPQAPGVAALREFSGEHPSRPQASASKAAARRAFHFQAQFDRFADAISYLVE